ncbi:MAG: amidohydrolase family protein [Hyphomicrobiaceae bacterium]|nr:amidohydrolase family protein [Hyphomicrobiaceae bacterium]
MTASSSSSSPDGTSVLANVRLPDGDIADIIMRDGLIADITAMPSDNDNGATRIEGYGMLVLPGLVDGHMHLDKALSGLPWMPHPAGPTRLSRIETEKALRASLPPVTERASNLVRQCVSHGTTAIRSHVDIDPDNKLSHFHALVEVREAFADIVDLQIVAFPQSGVLRAPGTSDLLDAALGEGADVLGGLDPIAIDNDLDGQLDILFAIAERHDTGIDIHLHDAGADGLKEINALCERTAACDLTGRVTVSHGFCLGAASPDAFARTADAMAEAGISLATHGGASSPLPPVMALRERGIEVFTGNDNVRDTWSPFGNGDMLERAMLLAWRSGYRTDDDLQVALDCSSGAGARILGLEGYGLAVGNRADLFTVDAETPGEAVAQRPRRGIVLKGGRVVAREGEFSGESGD